ncbi:O-antigen ligase family protein [Candidatus Saccharibacteria bacterium]|nr:O-antigen ligase family protein [Candidatus Saccharibacteria bacterium]
MSPKNHPKAAPSSKLTKFRLALLYSFPAALFCSYYPLFHFSESASTNYELSLSLIWLLLFSVLSLKDTIYYIYDILRQFKAKHSLKTIFPLFIFFFPLYLTLTALWSTNLLRAVLTSGILWCIFISAIGIIKLAQAKTMSKDKFLKFFLLTTCVFCGFCWLQSLLDIFGIDRSIALLCPGCTSYSFGFPHPSGFAIEPQFMGNLLLAPSLLSLHLWLKSKTSKTIFGSKTLLFISFFVISTLFLTFSRGAIYSFVLALLVLLVSNLIKLKNRAWLKTIPLVLISFLFTLFMQGIFSAASYTNSTFASGIENSISQLSLGKIELRLSPKTESSSSTPPQEKNPTETPPAEKTDIPVFDGYVEESTNTRMKFNRIALELSAKNTKTLLFGYGLGSAGETMFKEGKTNTPFEIVQNEYLSLILETGLLGLLLATLAIAVALSYFKKINRPERCLFGAVIISFLASLMFFSGLPNAVHLYLFPVFLAVTLPTSPRKQSSSPKSSLRA